MDLSKAYDCLPHDLLTAKLETCGLDKSSLNLANVCLSFRKQRTKIALHIVTGLMLLGFPQGSFLGPLLFNVSSIIFYYSSKNLINA